MAKRLDFVVDIDGVILNTWGLVLARLQERGLPVPELVTYDMQELPKDILFLVTEDFQTTSKMCFLPLIWGAMTFFDHYSSYNINIVSHRSPYMQARTENYLHQLGIGQHIPVYCTTSKMQLIQTLNPRYVVDDSPRVLEMVARTMPNTTPIWVANPKYSPYNAIFDDHKMSDAFIEAYGRYFYEAVRSNKIKKVKGLHQLKGVYV